MNDAQNLINTIDELKALLVDAATNQLDMNNSKFSSLKSKLLSITRLQELLPPFLKYQATLQGFRSMSQQQKDHRKHSSYAVRRDWIDSSFSDALEFLYEELNNPESIPQIEVPASITSDQVIQTWQKAMSRIQTDPDGAITSARSLLETVCKHILNKSETPYDRKQPELTQMYFAVIKIMNLAPDQQSEKDMQRVLQGCLSVVHGIGALRNRIGDAHGKDDSAGQVEAHHAFLGVSIACTVASFLIVSWEKHSEQQQNESSKETPATTAFVDDVIAVFGERGFSESDAFSLK